MENIRIGLCEDDPLFRGLLCDALAKEADFEIVGVASNRKELERLLETERLDVLLLDLSLSDGSGVEGLEAALDIRSAGLDVKIVVLSSYEDEELMVHALTYGRVVNYITKEHYRDIPEAIRQAHRNQPSLHHSSAPKLLGRLIQAGERELRTKVSPQQIQILTLLSQGHDRKEIAAMLYYTEQSVNNEIFKVTKLLKGKFPHLEWLRLKKQNTNEIVLLAKKLGIIP